MTPAEHDRIEAFSALVREHQAGLRAFIRALGADSAWVDDLAQEVFVVAYRRHAEFDPTADFGKWLRGIARHLVANERRKQARHSRLLPAVLVDALLDRAESDDAAEVAATVLLPAMRSCVAQLPPRSQELLHGRYTAGENAAQLAERLRTSADAIRQNLVRIRAVVKTCIERKLAGAPR